MFSKNGTLLSFSLALLLSCGAKGMYWNDGIEGETASTSNKPKTVAIYYGPNAKEVVLKGDMLVTTEDGEITKDQNGNPIKQDTRIDLLNKLMAETMKIIAAHKNFENALLDEYGTGKGTREIDGIKYNGIKASKEGYNNANKKAIINKIFEIIGLLSFFTTVPAAGMLLLFIPANCLITTKEICFNNFRVFYISMLTFTVSLLAWIIPMKLGERYDTRLWRIIMIPTNTMTANLENALIRYKNALKQVLLDDNFEHLENLEHHPIVRKLRSQLKDFLAQNAPNLSIQSTMNVSTMNNQQGDVTRHSLSRHFAIESIFQTLNDLLNSPATDDELATRARFANSQVDPEVAQRSARSQEDTALLHEPIWRTNN